MGPGVGWSVAIQVNTYRGLRSANIILVTSIQSKTKIRTLVNIFLAST